MSNNTPMSAREKTRNRILFLAQFALLLALEAIVCFTPLGSLPIGTLMVATLSHIPVILTAILLGPAAGAGMGFAFGLFSFLVWTFTPPASGAIMAFLFTPFYATGPYQGNFWSLVICFVPRILLGLICGLLCRAMEKRRWNPAPSYGISAVLASLLHTVLVFAGFVIFFGNEYASILDSTFSAMLVYLAISIATNGVIESLLAGVVGALVCTPVKKAIAKTTRSL